MLISLAKSKTTRPTPQQICCWWMPLSLPASHTAASWSVCCTCSLGLSSDSQSAAALPQGPSPSYGIIVRKCTVVAWWLASCWRTGVAASCQDREHCTHRCKNVQSDWSYRCTPSTVSVFWKRRLCVRWGAFGFYKMRGISWPAANQLASQEGPCSME